MILYLDASALVKRYVAERGSEEVRTLVAQTGITGTALISRAEVSAALGKAARMHVLSPEAALACLQAFHRQWPDLVRVQITELVVSRVDALAWEHSLRGYDAVHLAAALVWAEAMGEPTTLATFDLALWQAARRAGLTPFPAGLPELLQRWKTG